MEEKTAKFDSMMKRITFLPRLLGASPLGFSGSRFRISIFLLLVSLLLKMASGFQAVLQLFIPPIATRGQPLIYKLFVTGNNEYEYIVSCFCYYKIFTTRKLMSYIANLMWKSDLKLSEYHESLDHTADIHQDVLILLFMAIPTIIHFLDLNNMTFLFGVEQINFAWVNFTIYLSIAPFLRLVNVLKKRFHLLQRILSEVVSQRKEIRMLEELTTLHTNYCTVCTLLNDCFSERILLVFTVAFVSIAIGSYKPITSYLMGYTWSVIVLRAFLSFEYIIITVITTSICESASEEAKEFNNLLYQLMIDYKNQEIASNASRICILKCENDYYFPFLAHLERNKLSLHITMKKEIVFTAHGFFPLDYTLVHSMIAAATTYLVILIQFGQSTTKSTITLPANSTVPIPAGPFSSTVEP